MVEIKTIATHLGIISGVVVLWEAAARSGFVSPLIMSNVESIISFGQLHYQVVLNNLPTTLSEIGYSLIIILPLGIFLGIVFGYYSTLDRVFTPVFTALFAIPSFVFYPIMIAWFGLGSGSKIALALTLGFFPLVLNTIVRVRTIDRAYINYANSLGLGTLQTLRKIIIPFSIPAIIGSIRISVSFVIIGVIVAEMLGGLGGLGVLIAQYQSLLQIPGVYFVILFVFLTIAAFILGMGYIESWLRRRMGV